MPFYDNMLELIENDDLEEVKHYYTLIILQFKI